MLMERLYEKVKISGHHIIKLVSVVYKGLCNWTDSPEMVLQKPCFYEDVSESLRRLLVTPQETSCIFRFLRSVRWTISFNHPRCVGGGLPQ